MRARRMRVFFMALVLLLGVGAVMARGVLEGDQCEIAPDETLTGLVFVLCGDLTIEGTVTGDVIGAANRIVINGNVTGDVYLIGIQADIGGNIGEDLHFAGLRLNVQPNAQFTGSASDLISITASSTIQAGSTLPGDVLGIGYQLIIASPVQGELNFWGSALHINAAVGADVTASVGDPASDITQLRGFLDVLALDVSLVQPGFVQAGQAVIAGSTRITQPAPTQNTTLLLEEPVSGFGVYVEQVLREFTTFIVIGAVGLFVAPRALSAPIAYIRLRPLPSLGIGLLAFILSFPLLLIVLVITLVIIIVFSLLGHSDLTLISALFLGVGDLGGASIFYFTAIFLSRVIVSLAIGRVLVRRFVGRLDSWRLIYVSMAVGSLALALVAGLPVIGIGFTALAVFIGLGGILNAIQSVRSAQQQRLNPRPRQTIAQLPAEAGLGLENLPDGFRFDYWD